MNIATLFLVLVFVVGCNDNEFQGSAGRKSSDDSKKAENDGKDGPQKGATGADGEDGGNSGDDDSGGDTDNFDDSVELDSGAEGDGSKDKDKTDDGDEDLKLDESEISDKCDVPKGTQTSQSILGGEDVPGNGLVGGPDAGKPFGGDFDDFKLNLQGTHLIEKNAQGAYAKIGFTKETSVSVTYSRGTTDCSHSFKFLLRRCPNKKSTVEETHIMNIGRNNSGALTFKVPAKKLFLDIEITASASTTSQYGGCGLPFPVVNLLYGGSVPVLVQ